MCRPWKAAACAGILVLVVPSARPVEEPMPLPKMEVSAKPVPERKERWHYAAFSNFQVLSKESSGRMLTGLQEFDYSLRLVFPAIAAQSARPAAILLTHDKEYRDFNARVARGEEEFSRYFHENGQSAIVVNLDATEPADGLISFSSVDPHRQLNRQYLRHLLAQMGAKVPHWLEEGLAQTIADIQFQDSWLTYGKINTSQNMPGGEMEAPINAVYDFLAPNPALSGLSFKEAFSHRRLMPLDQFFAARLPDGSAPSSDSAWAKQAYAFVHFCVFGNKLRYRGPLQVFVQRLQTEPLSESLFQTCFGVNYARMATELRGYFYHTKHQYQRYELKPHERFKPEPIRFREASDDEIAVLKGGALLLAGNEPAAGETFRQAYLRDARSPDFLAAYAELCLRRGEIDRAREMNEAALAKGTLRPSARVLQARLLLGPRVDRRLGRAELDAVLTPLLAARRLQPPMPDTYLLMAEAWSRSESPPTPGDLATLDEGIRLFPRNTTLLMRSLELYRRIGDDGKVVSIARLGLRMTSDPASRAYFEPLAGTPATRL